MKATVVSVKKDIKSNRKTVPTVEIQQRPKSPQERQIIPTIEGVIPFLRNRRSRMESSSLPYDVLDLALDGVDTSELCRNTMKLLASARRVIVVAGAGISVAAGIPDFRSSTGLFSTLKADTKFKPSGKALFDASVYKVTPSIFRANS
jgi:NAD-dependent histone deacetylase SIR2